MTWLLIYPSLIQPRASHRNTRILSPLMVQSRYPFCRIPIPVDIVTFHETYHWRSCQQSTLLVDNPDLRKSYIIDEFMYADTLFRPWPLKRRWPPIRRFTYCLYLLTLCMPVHFHCLYCDILWHLSVLMMAGFDWAPRRHTHPNVRIRRRKQLLISWTVSFV